jgi:hydrogenase expression/formation protein HypE
VRTGGAHVGDHVLVTKGVGLEGTGILAQDFADVARGLGLGEGDLAEARGLMAQVSVVPEALALAAAGVTAMHDVTRGGLVETLLEIAYLSGVGIEIDGAQLSVPPDGAGVRVLQDGTAVHYTEIRCEDDELARMWALYPRDG